MPIEYKEPSENVVEFLKKLKNIMKEHEISLVPKTEIDFDFVDSESHFLLREKDNFGEEYVLSNCKIDLDVEDLERFLEDHSALRIEKTESSFELN